MPSELQAGRVVIALIPLAGQSVLQFISTGFFQWVFLDFTEKDNHRQLQNHLHHDQSPRDSAFLWTGNICGVHRASLPAVGLR